MEAWLAAALDDPHGHAYGAARSALFAAVRENRTGPFMGRLAVKAAHADPAVRLRVLQLLDDMCPAGETWGQAADVALAGLRDSDPRVRRRAAWLLASAQFPRAAALTENPRSALEPGTRLALVEATFSRMHAEPLTERRARAQRLSTDPDSAVQLSAALTALCLAPEAEWPRWEALALRTLPTAGARLGAPGGRVRPRPGQLWAFALAHQQREDAAYTWARRLAADANPVVRLAGVDLARGALRRWRASPDRLVPMLSTVLRDQDRQVREEAVDAVVASLATTRRCADQLAALMDDPGVGERAVSALARIGDQRASTRAQGWVRRGDEPSGLVGVLARGSATPEAWVEAARDGLHLDHDAQTCADQGWICPWSGAVSVVVALGPDAAPLVPALLDALAATTPPSSEGHVIAHQWIVAALGAIGPAAGAAVPLLTQDITSGARPAVAALALARITGDRAWVEECLERLPVGGRRVGWGVELLQWLVDNGGLSPAQVLRLDTMTQDPARMHPRTLGVLWKHRGPAAAQFLVESLTRYLDDDTFGSYACRLLADMGPFALPAVPALEAVVALLTRLPFHIGDLDEELRADERLLEAARTALAHITAASPGRLEHARRPDHP